MTGANGYLGKGVVKQLLNKGMNVAATDLKSDLIDNRAEIKLTDLFGIENPYEFFGKPDVFLHMAWRVTLMICQSIMNLSVKWLIQGLKKLQ